MSNARWIEVKALFDKAADLDPQGRDACLAAFDGDPAIRDEARSLLAADAASAYLEKSALRLVAPLIAAPPMAHIGPYRVVREIGRGGMGVVYLGQRDDHAFERLVAIKVVRPGADGARIGARFVHERQTLARLDHPNIARLYDGGTTEHGEAWFVMEYVDGLRIDDFCDDHRLGVDARLRLFLQVCAAVAYAHRHLVVHRDLKPDNLLVTADGTPRLLDFGIARLLDTADAGDPALTLDAGRPMTPGYASPEQVRGEPVTTATDVYSLGVLLYRLLSGRPPYRIDSSRTADIERAVCETTPPLMSAALADSDHHDPAAIVASRATTLPGLRRGLRGDLDTIVATALRKEVERRYVSVTALAEDIERHLSGRPVRARPDSLSYRTAKFVRRHAIGAAASVLILAAVAAGVVGTAWQARVASREAAKARQINAFVREMLSAANPYADPARLTVAQLLEQAARRANTELSGEPAVQAAVLSTIGESYLGLGLYADALTQLTRALRLANATADADDEVARALRLIGEASRENGDLPGAERHGQAAIAAARALRPAAPTVVAAAINSFGSTMLAKGDLERAGAAHREALAVLDAIGQRASYLGAETLNDLAVVLGTRGDPGSEALHREAVAICRHVLGSNHPHTAGAVNTLAAYLSDHGRPDEAAGLFEEALRVRRAALGPEHPDVAWTLYGYAYLHLDRHDADGAASLFGQILAMRGRTLPESHPMVASSLQALGQAEIERGRLAAAEQAFRESVSIRRRILPAGHWLIASSEGWLGRSLLDMGRRAEARPLILGSYARLSSALPAQHPAVRAAQQRVALLERASPDK